MTMTSQPWDGSASRWPTPVSYCAACLIDTNDGTKSKAACSLPVREPSGEINSNACFAAAAALAGARGASYPAAQKQAAARKLITFYREDLKAQPPDSLVALANQK
jgi:hypothetical protein